MPAKTKSETKFKKLPILLKTKFLVVALRKRIKKFQKRKAPLFSLFPLLVLTIFTATIATQVSNQRFELRKKAQVSSEIGLARVEGGELSPIQRLLNVLFPKRITLPSLRSQLSREDKELLQLGYPIPKIVIKQEGRVLKVDSETSRVTIKKDLPLELDASSSQGEIKGYTWTFGDFSELQEGTTLSRASHTYTEEGSYFLSLSLTTDDILKTNSVGLTIQVGTSPNSQLIQSYNFEEYYKDHPDQRPPQLTQQELTQMKQDFEKLLQENEQQRELSSQSLNTRPDKIAIVVDNDTYNHLVVGGVNLLEQYCDDVRANFPEVDLLLKKEDFAGMTGEQVRERLKYYWEQDHIDGAVLVGLIPYMAWEQRLHSDHLDQRGPCNLCFEDLDGRFYDTDSDGIYDTHHWNTLGDNIEIWVAWMRPPVSGARDYLGEFFQKTHRYYQEPEPKGYRKEAFFYAEESGPRGVFWESPAVRNLFLVPPYGEPGVVDYGTHSEAKLLSSQAFLNELSRSPEFAFFTVHGSPRGFGLYPDGTSPGRIRAATEGSLVTWAQSCSVANFYRAPSDNILQAFVFDSPGAQRKYNQAVVGIPFDSNWGVVMPLASGGFDSFFSHFFAGHYLGQALREFKIENAKLHPSYALWAGYPANNIPGFMLIGNPFVKHRDPPSYHNPRPQIREIHRQSGSSNITILGSNFGSEQGQVLADGFGAAIRGWNDGGISATLPDLQDSLSSHIRVWTPGGGNSESVELNYHKICHGLSGGSARCYGYPIAGTDVCQTTGLACNDPCQGNTETSSVSSYISRISLSSSQCRDCTISGWVSCGQPLSHISTFPVVLKYQGVELARAYPQGSYELYHPLDPTLTYTLELGDLPQGVTSDVHTIAGAPTSVQYSFYLDSCDLVPSPPDDPPANTCPTGASCGQSCVGQWECGDRHYCETGPRWCSNDNDLSNGYCCPDSNDPPPPPSACRGDEQIRFKWDKAGSVSIAAVSSDAPHADVRFSRNGVDSSENLIFVDRQSTHSGGGLNPYFDDPYLNPSKDHQWVYSLGRLMSSNLDDQRHDFNFYINCPEGTPLEDCSSNLCTANYLDYQFKIDPDYRYNQIGVGDTVRIGVRSDKTSSDVMLRAVQQGVGDVTAQALSWGGTPKRDAVLNPAPAKKSVWAWNFTPQSSGLYSFYFYINCSSQNLQDPNCAIVEHVQFSVSDL